MTDILYGADLGAVATDAYGNLFIGLTMNIYTDPKGVTPFTLTKKANDDLSVGASTAGQVVVNQVGRVMFYATDTDRTLYLKNGPHYWAINPASPADALQYRINAATAGVNATLDTFNARLTADETNLSNAVAAFNKGVTYQIWRARLSNFTILSTGNYKSLNFATILKTPTAFTVTPNGDTLSVSLAGWYRISARVSYPTNTNGDRTTQLLTNNPATTINSSTAPAGLTAEDSCFSPANYAATTQIVEDVYLTPTDQLMVVGRQNSGTSLSLVSSLNTLTVSWLGAAP